MDTFKKIIGKNLYLAPNKPENSENYCKWLNDKNISTRVGSWTKNFNLENEKKYLESITISNHHYGIYKLEDDSLIGSCGLKEVDQTNQKCDVGLFIGEVEEHNKGYGYEVLSILCDYGFNYLNMNSISLEYFSYNEHAGKCYKKVGFKDAGIKRQAKYCHGKFHDIIIMDMLKDEFNKTNEFSSCKK